MPSSREIVNALPTCLVGSMLIWGLVFCGLYGPELLSARDAINEAITSIRHEVRKAFPLASEARLTQIESRARHEVRKAFPLASEAKLTEIESRAGQTLITRAE